MSDKIPTQSPSSAEAVVARIREQRDKIRRWRDFFSYRLLLPLFCVFGGLGAVALVYLNEFALSWRDRVAWYAAIIGFLFGLGMFFYFRLLLSQAIRGQDKLLTGAGIVDLQETLDEDFFTKLVKINFKYIDKYYSQTEAQANKSFTLSAVVAIVALGIIIAGIVMMYLGKTQPAYVSAASGVMGEFIAAVFFYLYNRTIIKMSEYHQKLVITQNISLALKIAEGLPENERVRAQVELIQRLTDDCNRYLTQFKKESD
jgi:membrane associated rhomboid family serine protease